uniref:Uncharacterized protein n=1 Tax=Oryza sativa subsp. japonica TaxID=39947 RepID=Q2R252_ORYSJ|nr:hypothetical protein LOC_Os11g36980 [Oryza sativa Japonica Group]
MARLGGAAASPHGAGRPRQPGSQGAAAVPSSARWAVRRGQMGCGDRVTGRRQGCRVPGESLVWWCTGPAAATSSGVVTFLGHCRGIGDDGILDVVTTVVASFSESCLCGVAIGLAAFGHA